MHRLGISNYVNMAARTEAEIEGVFGQFHSRCGSKVKLSEGRRVASGPSGLAISPPQIAFSNAPIPRGLKFSVKVLQKSELSVSPQVSFRILAVCSV